MKNSRDEDLMRERLSSFEDDPSDELWDRISSAVPKNVPLWTKVTEVAGVLITMGGILLLFNGTLPEQLEVPANSDASVIRKSVDPAIVSQPLEKAGDSTLNLIVRQERFSENNDLPPITRLSQIVSDERKEGENELKQSDEKDSDSSLQSVAVSKSVIPAKSTGKTRFRFFASITPSLSFLKIAPNNNDNIVVQGMAPTPSLSVKRIGWSIDLGTQYRLNRLFTIYGGLTFYRQNQQLTYYYYDGASEVQRPADTWSFEVTPIKSEQAVNYTMTNIGIESGLFVTLSSRGLIHQFGFGLDFQKGLHKNRGEVYANNRSNYLMWEIFYRNEFPVNQQLSVFFQPNFSYGIISNETMNTPFTTKPYRAGISIGIILQK